MRFASRGSLSFRVFGCEYDGPVGPTVVYRTAVSRVLGYSAVVLAVLALLYFGATGGVREVARSGPLLVFAAVVVWVAFALPHVTVSDGGVTVRNVLRTTHVPWPSFTGVDSTWTLTVHTTGGDVASWAVPAASGFAARASHATAGQTGRGVNANVVALAIGERHEQLRDAGFLGRRTVQEVAPERHWNTGAVLALIVGALAALAGMLLG